MVRTQIQLDDAIYERVKNRAHLENRSMAALIRDAVDAYLEAPKQPKRTVKLTELSFIGSGSYKAEDNRPLSVYHDDHIWEEDWRD